MEYTKQELDAFLETYQKVESRIRELAPKLTSYCPDSAWIVSFSINGTYVSITTKYNEHDDEDPYNEYTFHVKYLAMSDEEVDAEVARIQEEARRRSEEYERAEFERLKAKFGSDAAGGQHE